MIRFESRRYRIEKFPAPPSPLPFALDRKERQPAGHVCLVCLGWFRSYEAALRAMTADQYPELVDRLP